MLVYSGTLWLGPNLDNVLVSVASWLKRKRIDVSVDFLKANNQKKTSEGLRVVVSRTNSDSPFLECIRFTHGDKEVPGRQWITEIGIRQENVNSEIECSILLKTEEISTRVEGKIQPTVPYVIHELIKNCSPTAKTVGLAIANLENDDETKAFGYAIDHPDRRHPFVLVSPTLAGQYLVNVDTLRFFLEGKAEIVVIPVGADTFRMRDVLGSQYVAYGGAVNLIFPEVNLHGNRFSPTKRLNPDVIDSIEQVGENREREILSIINHRTNLPNAWRHISFEKVIEQTQRDERKRLREQAIETGETAEYVALLESENDELEKKVASAEGTASEYETFFLQVDDENRQLRHQIESLELSLSYVTQTTTIEIPDYIENILDSISKYMTR